MAAKRMAQVVYLVSLALVAAACTATIRTPTPGPVVKLWGERGQVHLQHPDGPIIATSVYQPELVHTGDEITIGDESLGILTVAEFLRVEAFSKARLRVNTVPDPDGSPTVKLYLVSGTMLQELQRQVDQQVDVTMETYWVTIRAVSTACLVSVDDHEGTWVVVFYGEAEVEAQGHTAVVRTGQATWVEPYKEPRPPFDVSVTAVDAWANRARQVEEEVESIQQVIAASLTPTPTPTSTPTPTPMPTPTPTSTPTSTPTATPTLIPGKAHLISDLQISNLSPLVGESVEATFKVRNYGEQAFKAAKLLVKGQGPDGSIQDFRPREDFSLAPGAEDTYSESRSFSSSGRHWFTPYYSPDGVSWNDITWPDGRTSYVYINVVPDYPPQVTVSVKPATIYREAELGIRVTASDDIGLESIRWWSEGTGDESLDSGGEFVYDGGVTSFDKSWSQKWTGKKGKFTIHAQARDSASQLSSVVSAAITVLPTEKFSLLSGGEPFNDALVQVAMGLALNWPALREEVGEVVLVDFDSEETLADPKEAEYNPNLARSLLAQTGHERFDAVILYDSGDEPATELAEAVANDLNAVNISAARRGIASANARTRFADMIAAGESGFLIERRK